MQSTPSTARLAETSPGKRTLIEQAHPPTIQQNDVQGELDDMDAALK